GHIEDHAAGGHRTAGSGLASAGGAPTPRRPAARTSISKITPRTLTARQAPRWWSPEPVQGDECAEGLEGGGAVLRLGPARGLRGGDRPPDDELAVARSRQLVAQLGERVGCQVRERRRRLLVVLVLEPREVLDPPEDGRRTRLKAGRARCEGERPGSSASMMACASGS